MWAINKCHFFQFAVIEFHLLEITLIEFASDETGFCIETSFYELGIFKRTVYKTNIRGVRMVKVNVKNCFILYGGIFEIFIVKGTVIVSVVRFYHWSQVWEHQFTPTGVYNRLAVFFSQLKSPLGLSRRNKYVTVVEYWPFIKLDFKRLYIFFLQIGGVTHYIFA